LSVSVAFGKLPLESVELAGRGAGTSAVQVGTRTVAHTVKRAGSRTAVRFAEILVLAEGEQLTIAL
jgi:hypothetical protein